MGAGWTDRFVVRSSRDSLQVNTVLLSHLCPFQTDLRGIYNVSPAFGQSTALCTNPGFSRREDYIPSFSVH